ncbi:hypothetical protein CQY21_07710 [Mycolicibacterium boenickei]|uniref:Uncharacterized protein n=3 Tax=Mycolicibacterium boenickei TaxID=146017 RepID=A0ABM7INV5_9MYCO|nr:hypothetical protein CQY21_07710 [Mycolicibacterium boenickei]BBX88462.1 hypothetical protein MBOE_01110 [Mycolicibacterium boenickei]
MKLGWYVFMHRPDGGVMPIAGFWRKRTALRWVEENAEPDQQLEIHRFNWWSADAAGQRKASDPASGCPRSDDRR